MSKLLDSYHRNKKQHIIAVFAGIWCLAKFESEFFLMMLSEYESSPTNQSLDFYELQGMDLRL